MTIFVDPYHTTTGVTLDTTKVVTPLKECTIRDPLTGSNLGVRAANSVVPVFVTGCRNSEKAVPSFTHPIFIKNFNGKSYLFTDMTLFVSSGGTLSNIDSHIRRREEFDFTKARGIASLVWASGDTARFRNSMGFAGDVFASWIGQALSRNFALDFMDQIKVQLIALAFYQSLFVDGPVVYSDNDDKAALCARQASNSFRVPFTDAVKFYKGLTTPMASINDMCEAIVKTLDNVNLNPAPGRPDTGFNLRVLLNLISDAWFSTNSKLILSVAVEHPPTLCAIIYYCINYNNFRRQALGQTIQQCGKNGKAEAFSKAFSQMLEEMQQPESKLIPVMEYRDPANFLDKEDDGEVAALLRELNGEGDSDANKVVEGAEIDPLPADILDPQQ